MAAGGFFSISEFAKFSRLTRDTLLHYDKIGLINPVFRGENNYRYYSSRQFAVVNVIRTLQKLGMSLNEIKKLKDRRTPELANEVFTRQIEKINQKIEDLNETRTLLLTLQKSIQSVSDIEEDKITIAFYPEEPVVFGDYNDYSRGGNDYDALLDFYGFISKKYPDLDLNYSVWAVFSKERIINGDWIWPDRYYFNNPEGPDVKPAALYAVGYTRGGYGKSGELYKRMIEYININGFEICGDAYEEYPLNEVCISEDKNYLMRVMISVREKNKL